MQINHFFIPFLWRYQVKTSIEGAVYLSKEVLILEPFSLISLLAIVVNPWLEGIFVMRCAIWYHSYNLKKREKHPWRTVNFSKVAGFSATHHIYRRDTMFLKQCRNVIAWCFWCDMGHFYYITRNKWNEKEYFTQCYSMLQLDIFESSTF